MEREREAGADLGRCLDTRKEFHTQDESERASERAGERAPAEVSLRSPPRRPVCFQSPPEAAAP